MLLLGTLMSNTAIKAEALFSTPFLFSSPPPPHVGSDRNVLYYSLVDLEK